MTDLQILDNFGKRITEQLKQAIRELPVTRFGAVNASGRLADSVRYEVNERGLKVFAADYIYYIEHGRAPGKFPPIDSIKQWIEDKGLNFDIPVNSLAFLIARKIAQKGTTAWQQGGTELVESVINDDLIKEITVGLLARLKIDVMSEILKAYGKAA